MVASINSHSDTFDILFYNAIAAAIVVIGVCAFGYVGEQIDLRGNKMDIAIEAPRTAPQ